MSRFWGLACAVAVAALQADAHATGTAASASAVTSAAPKAPAAPPLAIHVQPIFGNEAAVGYGWEDFVVTIDNPTAVPQKGVVELRAHNAALDCDGFVAKAPFAVTAGHSVTVRLPMRARTEQVPQLTLRVTDDHNVEVVALPVTPNMAVQPTLIDVDNPSRLSIPLHGWPATVTYSMTPTYSYYAYAPPTTTAMTLAVAAPEFLLRDRRSSLCRFAPRPTPRRHGGAHPL